MSSRGDTSGKAVKYIPNSLRWLIVITGVLIVIGCLNIYSSTYYMNIHSGGSAYSHISSHLLVLFIGLISSFFVMKIGTDVIRTGTLLWFVITVFLLLFVMVAGRTVNGATRWISIGSFSLQPSEIAKIVGIIWTSSYLSKRIRAKEKITFFSGIFKRTYKSKEKGSIGLFLYHFMPIIGPAMMALLILKQPDMGTAGMVLIFPAVLYILAGMPSIEIVSGIVIAAVGGLILAVIEPYRFDRLVVLWDPFSHARDLGYQTVQSLIAVGSGGFFGQGPGEGMAKFLYLPEQYTDFAYAVFSQEFGFIGSAIVLFLYVGFLLCGFSCARLLKQSYESLLVYGLTMLISIQGIINIAMVIGCFPVTGIPLPFISYGGTSLLINLIAVGLIWKTVVSGLEKSDMAERKRKIAAMEGRPVSLGKISGSIFYR